MANELKHKDVGTQLTYAEYHAVDEHVFDSQATGDIMYASSATQLSRLGITAGRILGVSGGVPAWVNTLPAMSLGGTLSVQEQLITNVSDLQGPTTAVLSIDGRHTAAVRIRSQNSVGTATARLSISGDVDTAVAAWSAITHTGFVLGGNMTVTGYAFDAGSGSARVNTTGQLQGLILAGSHASDASGLYFYHEHTTPDLNTSIGRISFYGYDGAGTPVFQRWGYIQAIYADVTDTTEDVRFDFYGMNAGAVDHLAAHITGAGVVSGDEAYAEFDDFEGNPLDDAKLMVKEARPMLEKIGVLQRRKVREGTGYMLNFQKAIYLGWGGIRQNRAKIDDLEERLTKIGG